MRVHSHLIDGQKAVEHFSAVAERCADLSQPMTRLGQHHQRKMTRIVRSGKKGVKARHAGGLADSFTFSMVDQNLLEVGSNKEYAAAQQFGGTLKSSRPDGWLAIPIADNIKGRKDPRFTSPREIKEGGYFFKSKKGNLLFARRIRTNATVRRLERKADQAEGLMLGRLARMRVKLAQAKAPVKIELLFVLKKSVEITKHLYAVHEDADQTRWERFVSDWILRGKT